MSDLERHWNDIFAGKTPAEMSWYQTDLAPSLDLLKAWADSTKPFIDIGAGSSLLADLLLNFGWLDVSVLDISEEALAIVRGRLGAYSDKLAVINADIRRWTPTRQYGTWHDRAVFHFLVDPADRGHYVETATRAVVSGGTLIVATFAADGPEQCSGLPVQRYEVDDLAMTFAPAFVLEDSRREEHVTPFHTVQPFNWVVLRRG